MADERSLQIWYRSSDGCPEGAAFVQRLSDLGRHARLASVGDQVDFVVTVAYRSEQSSGRLERQTELGTMAIREISAPRCDEVAEGLALSLDLALDPAPVASSGASTAADADAVWALSLGLEATVATAIAPDPMPGIAVYAELTHREMGASAFVALRGGRRESEVNPNVDLGVLLLAGRVVGCPLGLGSGAWLLQPCLGVELGRLSAESSRPGGRSDAGLWASGVGLGRASWLATDAFSMQFELGAVLPLVRYELGADAGAAIFRTGEFGLEAGLGAAWRLP